MAVHLERQTLLAARGVDVANIVTPNAAVAAPLKALGQPVSAIANLNQYDVLAMARLRAHPPVDGVRASEPSQVNVNWQPVVRVEPW